MSRVSGWGAFLGAWWAALPGITACSVQDSQLLVADASGGPDGRAGAGAGAGACPVELVGWATVTANGVATTTGGGDVAPEEVTLLEELRTLAGDDVARVIELSGTFVTGPDPLVVTSDKTLLGVGPDAIIEGGIRIENASNVILRNINVHGAGPEGSPADALTVRTSHHLWFDHLSVRDGPDGNLDVTSGSDHVTVSWSRFWYTDPAHPHRLSCLVGAGSTQIDVDTGKNNVTYHHNWFADWVDQAMPRILFGRGHVFNSYYGAPGNAYCIGAGSFASVLIENNYFQDVSSPHRFADTGPSYITAKGNVYENTSGSQDTGLGGEAAGDVTPFTSPPYAYSPDVADDVPALVTRCAGPRPQ